MKKKIIYEIKGLYRDSFRITGFEFGKGKKSLCIVGSMRGNEVQQVYCCSQLVKKFKQLEDEGRITPGVIRPSSSNCLNFFTSCEQQYNCWTSFPLMLPTMHNDFFPFPNSKPVILKLSL